MRFWLGVIAIGLACGLFLSPVASAHLLVLESSDQHSSYDQIPTFLRYAYQERANFLRRYPLGKVVLVINGDFSGLSAFSFDDGDFNYELLTLLAHDFELVVNLGNHEAFDWSGARGNRLFQRQAEKLIREVSAIQGKPFFLTTANLQLGAEGEKLFRPHRDIPLGAGNHLRFVGLVLESFFTRSNYDRGNGPDIIREILPSLATVTRELAQAKTDGIQAVSLLYHDGSASVENDLPGIRSAVNASQSPPIAAVFAAHDHLLYQGDLLGIPFFNAGHGYSFHSITLDDHAQILDQHVIFGSTGNVVSQHPYSSEWEKRAIEEARAKVQEAEQINSTSVGFLSFPVLESRRDLQAARTALGTHLADALVAWAHAERTRLGQSLDLPVIAFYNSSSYRRDMPLEVGRITRGTIRSMYPMPSRPMVVALRGAEVERLFSSLRRFRQREPNPRRRYSPQLSRNLVEGTVYSLGLDPEGEYLLALDGWLANNGYALAEWTEILSKARRLPTAEITQTELLETYLPPQFNRGCVTLFASPPNTPASHPISGFPTPPL